jgi:hypothetical protein
MLGTDVLKLMAAANISGDKTIEGPALDYVSGLISEAAEDAAKVGADL